MRKSDHGPPWKQLNTKSMIIYQTITMISIFVLISILNEFCYGSGDNLSKNCRERDRLIEYEKGDLYTLIDATIGEKLTLQCHYCGENDDSRPKIWYKIDNFVDSKPHEVHLDMNNNPTENKIHVNNEHSLVIKNFNHNDTGLYYCKRFEGETDEEEKYNYLVDLIYDEKITPIETGNFTDWRKYYEEHFVPINALFQHSQGAEFTYIRTELGVEMEAVTQWQPWGICEVCGRPKNNGIRKKQGLCRVRLTVINSTLSRNFTSDEKFLTSASAIACRSQILGRLVPSISNMTRIVPNFVQVQPCEGTCNPDAEGVGKGWKTGKTAAFKYRRRVVLKEGAHLTLICPESSMENVVVWKRNGKVLKAGRSVPPSKPEDEPHIIVDTFNTLYLVKVQESEEGNYTCQVDDIRMQQIIVNVVSKAKILTHAFVRHMVYLLLILSLTIPCYCAGLIVTCHRKRRRAFKDYQELKEIETERLRNRGLLVP